MTIKTQLAAVLLNIQEGLYPISILSKFDVNLWIFDKQSGLSLNWMGNLVPK